MKTSHAILVRAFVLLSLSLSARAQAPAPASALDYGEIDGRVYTNQFFGLTLTLPEGWQAHGEAAKKQISEAGRKLIGPKDPARVAQAERDAKRSFNLLTATQYPLGTPAPSNATFVCFAERLPAAAAGLTDAEYMEALKRSLQTSTQARVTIERDVYTAPVGGKPFSVIQTTSEFGGEVKHHTYYARVMNGYALIFGLSYPTPEPLPAQADAIKSVRLR